MQKACEMYHNDRVQNFTATPHYFKDSSQQQKFSMYYSMSTC